MDLAHLESFHAKTNSKPLCGAAPGTLLVDAIRHDPGDPSGVVTFTLTYRPEGWPDHAPGDLDGLLSEVDAHAEATPASDTE